MSDPMPSWTTGRWLCALCRAWGDGGADGLDDHHQRIHKDDRNQPSKAGAT